MSGALELDLAELVGEDEVALRERIVRAVDGCVRVSFTLSDAYLSMSKWELALSWLKGWYIAERLVESSHNLSHEVVEADRGAAVFVFNLRVRDPQALAITLADLAPAFDPDDLEAEAELGSAAEGWLEERTAVAARFPDLEEAYRSEAEQAAEDDDAEDE